MIVKILLQDREARSLTSSGSVIYYLSSAGITPICSSENKTRKIQALLNLLFYDWVKLKPSFDPPPFFPPKYLFTLSYFKRSETISFQINVELDNL